MCAVIFYWLCRALRIEVESPDRQPRPLKTGDGKGGLGTESLTRRGTPNNIYLAIIN